MRTLKTVILIDSGIQVGTISGNVFFVEETSGALRITKVSNSPAVKPVSYIKTRAAWKLIGTLSYSAILTVYTINKYGDTSAKPRYDKLGMMSTHL